MFSVAFALLLNARGLPALVIGVVLTLALLAGAGFSLATGALVRRFGQSATLLAAAAVMALAAAILGIADGLTLIIVASLLGTLSAGGQEVGPFAPIEQHIIVETSSHGSATRAFALYNLAGSFAAAAGALLAGFVALAWVPWLYAACAVGLLATYAFLAAQQPVAESQSVAERLAPQKPLPSSGVGEK